MLGLSREKYRLDTPSVGRARLDPQKYWQACLRTVRRSVEQAGVRVQMVGE
jgi:sugar (pentulose or hexulose) kinase